MSLVNIKMHGELGKAIGRDAWKLAVKSVGEAMRAIETLSQRKLYNFLLENDKKGVKYEVLINGREFLYDKVPDPKDLESVRNSELMMNTHELKTIDVIPVLEGSDSGTGAVIVGALLIVAGIVVGLTIGWTGIGGIAAAGLIIAGIGLLAVGVIALLSKPPDFADFREIQGSAGKASYLFNGPENTTREGGPVPVGYGRLLVGSQVISASYELTNQDATVSALTT